MTNRNPDRAEDRGDPHTQEPTIAPGASADALGPRDIDQPEPGPDPSVGGTDLPGQAQVDLTGDEPDVRLENQPPPRGMKIPRRDRPPTP